MVWTLTAAVGLLLGISFGILIALRYVVLMDRKIEKMLYKIEKIDYKIEHNIKGKGEESGEDEYKCPECDKTFDSERGMKIHKAQAH